MGGLSSLCASLYRSLRGGTAVFTLPSLHRKFPFLTRMSETGSMTGWGLAVRSLPSPPSSRSKPQISGPAPNRPFLWGFSPVSFRSFGLWWHWWSLRPISASRLCIQKFRSPQQGFDGQYRLAVGNIVSLGRQKKPCRAGRNYCGFNPSTSNCRLHSAGASRNRSTPIPRGSRPSTPARTRSGARNASEMVMLTWRTLHF
jgi:hypothetical protein